MSGGRVPGGMALWNPFSPVAALVRTTVGTRADAERLARRLVEGRLAACVHIVETSSVYRWDGVVRQETEFLVEARTTLRRRGAVEDAMLQGHPYETPLVESLHGSAVRPAAYAAWMQAEVR